MRDAGLSSVVPGDGFGRFLRVLWTRLFNAEGSDELEERRFLDREMVEGGGREEEVEVEGKVCVCDSIAELVVIALLLSFSRRGGCKKGFPVWELTFLSEASSSAEGEVEYELGRDDGFGDCLVFACFARPFPAFPLPRAPREEDEEGLIRRRRRLFSRSRRSCLCFWEMQ